MLHAQAPLRRLGAALCTLLVLTGCSAGGGAAPEKGAPAANAPASAPAPVQVEVVAHRGGYPENTLAAFKQALSHPDVGAIELDVQVSKDGELFVMHDKTVDRTTTGKGAVADLTSAQLRALQTPKTGAGEPIPLLDEALALVAATPAKRVLVEIKEPTPADTPAKVVAAINKHGLGSRAIVTSFDRNLVEASRKLAPAIATGFVSKKFGSDEFSYPGEYLLITSGAVTREKVAEAHKAGKKVYVWTVDEKTPMEGYVLMGADGLISNEYGIAAEVKKSH